MKNGSRACQPTASTTRLSVGRINAALPADLQVLASGAAPDGFDARRDAIGRVYRYRAVIARAAHPLERGRALRWPYPIERDALETCAAMLPGVHDFTAFTPTKTYHQRFQREVFGAEWVAEGGDDTVSLGPYPV